jgi:hypothetical protein
VRRAREIYASRRGRIARCRHRRRRLDGGDISTEDLRRRLKAELHGIWGLTAAKKICAALEEIAPDWVEDPIWMDRISDVAELAASTRAPLAGGETLGGLGQVRELIQVGRIGTPIIEPGAVD